MIAHGLDTLVAETYISSHPLSGLVLLSPPTADQLPSPPPSFNWEPMLPVAIFEESHRRRQTAEHRLLRDWKQYVDLEEVPSGGMAAEETAEQVLRWMDANGL